MTAETAATRHRHEEPSASGLPMLIGLVCLTTLASAGAATALPSIASAFSLTPSAGAWIQGSYVLGFAISTALFGRLVDLRGISVVRSVGIGMFAAGAVIAAVAWSPTLLFAGRLVEGAGGGAIPVLADSMLAVIADDARRQRAMGRFTAVLTGTSAVGPLAGGLMASGLDWRALVALPILGLLALPRGRSSRSAPAAPDGSFNVMGAFGVACLASGVLLALQSGTQAGHFRITGFAAAIAAVGGLGIVVREAARRDDAFVPAALVRNRSFVAVSMAGFSLFAVYFGLLFLVPLLIARSEHWDPDLIGLCLLPAGVLGAGCSLLSGKLTVRSRRRPVRVAVCLASAAAGLICAAAPSPWLWVVAMGIASGALGIGNAALLGQLVDDVPKRQQGIALGLFNVCFFLGGAVATVLAGTLLETANRAAASAALACFPLLATIVAAGLGRRPDDNHPHGSGRDCS